LKLSLPRPQKYRRQFRMACRPRSLLFEL
jgi:hypothetical protein